MKTKGYFLLVSVGVIALVSGGIVFSLFREALKPYTLSQEQTSGIVFSCKTPPAETRVLIGAITYDVWAGYPYGDAKDQSAGPGGEFDFKQPFTGWDERQFSYDFGKGTERGLAAATKYKMRELVGALDYLAIGWYPKVWADDTTNAIGRIADTLDAYLSLKEPKPKFALIVQNASVSFCKDDSYLCAALMNEFKTLISRPEYLRSDEGRPVVFHLADDPGASESTLQETAKNVQFAFDTFGGGPTCAEDAYPLRRSVPCISNSARPLGIDLDHSERLRSLLGLDAISAYGTVRTDSGDFGHQSAQRTIDIDIDRARRNIPLNTLHVHSVSPMNDHRPRHPESTWAVATGGPQWRYWFDELTQSQWYFHITDMAQRIACPNDYSSDKRLGESLNLGTKEEPVYAMLIYALNEIDEGGLFMKAARPDPYDPNSGDRYLIGLRALRGLVSLDKHSNTYNDDRRDWQYKGAWEYYGPAAVHPTSKRPTQGPHGRVIREYRPGYYGNDESTTAEFGAVATLDIPNGYGVRLEVHAPRVAGRGVMRVECEYRSGSDWISVPVIPAAEVDLGQSPDQKGIMPASVATCRFEETGVTSPKRVRLIKVDSTTNVIGFDRVVEWVDFNATP